MKPQAEWASAKPDKGMITVSSTLPQAATPRRLPSGQVSVVRFNQHGEKEEVEEALSKEETLRSFNTEDVMFPESKLEYAGTDVVEQTIKSTEEVVQEMRTWLKTGIAPDGTRMMTDEASQWYQDFYQATVQADPEHECLPEGSKVDYYYWTSPYLAHIGNVDLVMMHSQVNLRDNTHLPCDRLREATKAMKNLERMADRRYAAEARNRQAFVDAVVAEQHRGHPLRKDGIYTRYLWSPLHQRTIEEMK